MCVSLVNGKEWHAHTWTNVCNTSVYIYIYIHNRNTHNNKNERKKKYHTYRCTTTVLAYLCFHRRMALNRVQACVLNNAFSLDPSLWCLVCATSPSFAHQHIAGRTIILYIENILRQTSNTKPKHVCVFLCSSFIFFPPLCFSISLSVSLHVYIAMSPLFQHSKIVCAFVIADDRFCTKRN